MKYFRFLAPDVAIDLGTSNSLVARVDRGIVLNEPTVVALDFQKLEILAIGQEAKELMGKSPTNVAAIRPLHDGVISDFNLTQALLEYYLSKALPGLSLVAPRLTISVPSGSTDVESRAIQDACLQAGARDVYLVEETLASAYGAGLINSQTEGAFILNMGAGTTEVAVVSGYGVITSETLHKGGDAFDEAIAEYIAKKYDLDIGKNTAERLKITIGSLFEDQTQNVMEISGRDLISGMPKSIDVISDDIRDAMIPLIYEVVDSIRLTLEKTPPELAADIMKTGLLLTGGASQMDGFKEYIHQALGVEARYSEEPLLDTIHGVTAIMKNIDLFKNKRGRS